jgi:parallel beta-helix repeat protein
MTKTQLKILEAKNRSAQIIGAARYFFALKILFLEMFVAFHKIGSHFVLGKHKTFEKFAQRNQHGVITDSFTEHERFHKISIGSTTLAIVLSVIYAFVGVLSPTKTLLHAASLVVNDNSDTGDGTCDSSCTLRDAILDANSNPGVDSISFNSGMTIALASALPEITETISIDGDIDASGDPDVILDGTGAGSANGFNVGTNDVTISGFVIQGFSSAGISIQGNNNIITNNYIGTNVGGSAAAPNSYGVLLDTGSSGNVIGGTNTGTSCTAPCNLIAGNDTDIRVQGASQGNFIRGNVFGLTLDMSKPISLDNNGPGVSIGGGAFNNVVGGNRDENASEIGQGNVFGGYASDSDHDGFFDGSAIQIDTDGFDAGSSTGNSIFGNLIGLNGSGVNTDAYNNVTAAAGADDINDLRNNVGINTVADYTQIGDGTALHRNAISGNIIGISMGANSGIDNVVINGNYIGLDKTGEISQYPAGYDDFGVFNFYYGILAYGTSGLTVRNNIISDFSRRNFSSNTVWGYGIYFGSTSLTSPNGDNTGATIAGNKFGTDKDGVTARGSITSIACEQLSFSLVGGIADSERNIISASGISFDGGPFEVPSLVGEANGCHDNTIRNNYIGTTVSGNSALTNGAAVNLRRGAYNITVQNNLFGDFSSHALTTDSASFLSVHDNTFGFGANGTTFFSIGGNGAITASKTTDSTFNSNQIGKAGHGGIVVTDSKTLTIQNNYIGTDSTETQNFGNGGGINIANSSSVDVLSNVVKDNIDLPFEKYFLANSYFAYNGNEYSGILGANSFECLMGQKGIHTVEYNATYGTITLGEVCTGHQVFLGSELLPGSNESALNTTVKAYLISKAGNYYTFIVSQPDAGPFTCSTVAASLVAGGVCDEQFILYTRSGGDYSTQSLPAGTTLGVDAAEPNMTHEKYTAGISILGANGDFLVQDNRVVSNASNGINLLGGTGITFDQNIVTDNSDDGVDIIRSEGDTLTSNTIENNGDNGIQLSFSEQNSIGTFGLGNTISGHAVSGIALNSQSNQNILYSNLVTDNGNAGSVTGSGLSIHESLNNEAYDNRLNENVYGVILDSGSSDTSGNTVGGSGINEPNTINQNTAAGVLVRNALTQANTIVGNTVSSNGTYGIENIDTHDTSGPRDGGDNAIVNNDVTLNTLSGIRNYGASPSIHDNTLTQNSEHGVKNLVDYGSNTNPSTASDDLLAEPAIYSNIFNTNAHYGIYSLDTAPTNKSTLATDNTFDNGNVEGRVRQEWYGLVDVTNEGSPENAASVTVKNDTEDQTLASITSASSGYAPDTASLTDVQTWQVIPEFSVSPTGTLQQFAPHKILAVSGGLTESVAFNFNGEVNAANVGPSGFGNVNGRYQAALVNIIAAPNTINGTVYNDTNENGTQDSGESGKSGVTVTLYKSTDATFGSDTVSATTTTASDGTYSFSGVTQGNYFVSITKPTNYSETTSNPGSLITFASENETASRDFGVAEIPTPPVETTPSGTIRGTVFEDKNSNKIFESGESGVSGVTVRLYADSNGNEAYDSGTDQLLSTRTSNSSGVYRFIGIGLRNYFLVISVPSNRSLTTANNPTVVLKLDTDGKTITENFGLTAAPETTPTPTPEPTPKPTPGSGGGVTEIIKNITGGNSVGSLVAPKTGAGVANSLVAIAVAVLGIINVLLAAGSSLPVLLRLLLDLFTEPFLALFGSKKLPWGRLFDSLTNVPIDLGIVRLYDANSNRLLATAVTDRTGRFKFLPKPGRYIAKVTKSHYIFPSSLLTAAPSYQKPNYYFGEAFSIDDAHQTFNRDIPLDHEEVKGDSGLILKLRAKQTAHTVFAFSGVTIAIVNMIIILSWLTFGLLILHLVLLVVFWRLAQPKKPKPWGMVYDQESKQAIKGAVIRIYDQKFGRLLDATISDRNGKFGFLVGASEYYMVVEAKGYIFPGFGKTSSTDYIGGPIRVKEHDEAIRYNIPLRKERE